MSEQHVVGEKKDGLFYITLNRPDKRNAITFEMLIDISKMVEELIFDPEVRAVIIRGEGKAFSAGADFQSLAMLLGRFTQDVAAGGASIRADIHQYQQYLNRLEAIEIPIICVMHGAALGMSLELALACDIRLMSDDCTWGMYETKFGVIPDLGGTARLAELVGPPRAMEILMASRNYPAETALRFGLVNHLYPADKLFDEAESLAKDIAKCAPLAVGAVKKICQRGRGVDLMTRLDMEVNLQSQLLRTEDFSEGITSMLEGRAADWKRK
jgi:enoyl-CoA hydratase/carnithine racemase